MVEYTVCFDYTCKVSFPMEATDDEVFEKARDIIYSAITDDDYYKVTDATCGGIEYDDLKEKEAGL